MMRSVNASLSLAEASLRGSLPDKETHEALIDQRLPDDLGASGNRFPSESARVIAGPLDHFGNALSAKLADRGISRKPPCAARPFGVPIDLIASVVIEREVRRPIGQRGVMGRAICDESVSTIKGHVQPLVAVGGP